MWYLLLLSFVPNSNLIMSNEFTNYNDILVNHDLPCHLSSCRVKTFKSAIIKHSHPKYNKRNIYDLHDLISFRFVFYNKEDLLKFYHYNKLEKDIVYFHNYIQHPKENGYKAMHFHYRISGEKIDKLECQLYTLEDYYNSVYGNSSDYKDYLNSLKE